MLSKDKSNYAVLISEETSIFDAKNGKVKSSRSILSHKYFYNLDAPKAMFSTIREHLMSADEQYFVVNSNQLVIPTLASCELFYIHNVLFSFVYSQKKKEIMFFLCKLSN